MPDLPAPTDEDARMVMATVLTTLNDYWQAEHVLGKLIRWPACDLWFEPLLLENGFLLDSVLAYHLPQPLAPSRRPVSPLLQTRLALPQDEEVLVELFREESLFHQPYTPFVLMNPGIERAFRHRLVNFWTGANLEAGGPLVVVVERAQEVVAMAEITLLDIGRDDEPGYLSAGRYGYISNVAVNPGDARTGYRSLARPGRFRYFRDDLSCWLPAMV